MDSLYTGQYVILWVDNFNYNIPNQSPSTMFYGG